MYLEGAVQKFRKSQKCKLAVDEESQRECLPSVSDVVDVSGIVARQVVGSRQSRVEREKGRFRMLEQVVCQTENVVSAYRLPQQNWSEDVL